MSDATAAHPKTGGTDLSIDIRFSPHPDAFRNLDFEGHLVLDNADVGMHLGHDGALALFDKRHRQAIWWFHAPDDTNRPSAERLVAPWHRAAPLRQVLHWHCVSRGQALLHAAAVSLEGRAALITGAGGSGKSTTSLLCHENGFGFLADDYCIVQPRADRVAVHGLYRTAKLTTRSQGLVPEAMRHPHIDVDQHKRAVFLPDAIAGPLPVDVLLIARVDESGPSRRSRATRMQALAAAGPTSVLQQRGAASDVLGLLAEVVRRLPTEHLTVSPAVDGVLSTVRSALQDHRP